MFPQLEGVSFPRNFSTTPIGRFPPKYLPKLTKMIFCQSEDGILEIDNSILRALPPSITHIKFSVSFNTEVTANNLPPFLTHLCFGSNFNQPVNNLPKSIVLLYFGREFKHPVNHLPPNLISLQFADSDNVLNLEKVQ